jgi:hypothetical protein
MKNTITLIFASMLMGSLCLGCDRNEPYDGIRPVTANSEVKAFFNENLGLIAETIFYDHNDFENREFIDSCVMINSKEEFLQIDFRGETPPELPAIDFDAYTLIIGQWIYTNTREYLISKRLIVEHNEAIITLFVGRKDGLYTEEEIPRLSFFWELYPKTITTSINTITIPKN